MASDEPIDGAASLVIAITGHRDLFAEDWPVLEAEIRHILEGERRKYPSTPLLLLSGLAEGADRIAVRTAMSLSIPYMAVLPMEAEYYTEDFSSPESVNDFYQLLQTARGSIVMPPTIDAASTNDYREQSVRDRQYESLAQFLVNASQILIAIWDRAEGEKQGGTGAVVRMKLGRNAQSGHITFARINASSVGPVYVLLARRLSTWPTNPIGAKCKVEYPRGTAPEEFEESYKLLDRYNAAIAAARGKQEEVRRSWEGLCEGTETTGLTPAMEWVAGVYSWADTLANHYEQRSLLLWNVVFTMLIIGGVCLGLLHLFEDKWSERVASIAVAVLVTYFAVLVAALVVALSEARGHWRQRHEDYRALAEALRVQYFWLVAGLPDVASEKYLRKQSGEMIWIRDAMSECFLFTGIRSAPNREQADAAARLDFARLWVKGQVRYFRRTSLRYLKKRRIYSWLAITMAGVGFALLVLAVMGHFIPYLQKPWPGSVFLASASVAFVWASLAWNYLELRGFKLEARQYSRMYELFRAADELLEDFQSASSTESFAFAEETIRELGVEALAENGDWLAMHRERKLNPGLATG